MLARARSTARTWREPTLAAFFIDELEAADDGVVEEMPSATAAAITPAPTAVVAEEDEEAEEAEAEMEKPGAMESGGAWKSWRLTLETRRNMAAVDTRRTKRTVRSN